ncbi:MAG: thymidine phosphorylase [Candidatus Tyrphobacter sp.]
MHFDESAMRRALESKRDGGELDGETWEAIVGAYLAGDVGEAQVAALLMATLWRGMSLAETAALTKAMVDSGETLSFPADLHVVDKHSSGGVSDVVSLVAIPLAAACGARVAKLSGRALGHTGGTIDKLDAIPGVRTALTAHEFVAQVERVGCAIAAQSERIVPADKRLYALRDRTGTVPSPGLIVASILSKKIAGGAQSFVFDVKCGSAAFVRDPAAAQALARELVEVAARFGRGARALVTDMNEPLGHAIGTGIEAIEARDVLCGSRRDGRVRALVLRIVHEMLALCGDSASDGKPEAALDSGAAYETFVAMIEAQGGSRASLEGMHPARRVADALAPRSGYVGEIDGIVLGNLARALSVHESTAGIVTNVRIGDAVCAGDVLAHVHGERAEEAAVAAAFTIVQEPPPQRPLVYHEAAQCSSHTASPAVGWW